MKKNTIRIAIVWLILLVIYQVIVFAIPFTHNGTFWLSYVFSMIAFGVLGVATYMGEIKGDGVKSKFYGFPILRLGAVYCALQVILSLVVMTVGMTKIWVALIAYVILLGAACIGLIAADAMKEEIERQDVGQKKNTSMMLSLRSKAGTLPGLTEDVQMKKALMQLSENFRFSDPVSSDALAEIEAELTSLLDELQKALLEKDVTSADVLCKQADLKLIERNRLCKLNK